MAASRKRRATAADRLKRLLAMIPWLAANDGPKVADVCARFGITKAELQGDLELLMYVGVPPYTPERLFLITIEGGRVWAHLTPTLDRPLRLTPDEALGLVVAGQALAAVPGAEENGALARALAKVAAVLGIDPADAVEVDLGAAAEPTLALLRHGVEAKRQVEIDYYAFGRDERTRRTVDPWSVVNDQGAWYLVGHDHLRGAQRSFRIDRILSARLLDGRAATKPTTAEVGFAAGDDVPRVTLEVDAAARWVAEAYPVDDVEELDDGGVRVTLAVTATPWLERVLLRLGPHGRLVAGPAGFDEIGRGAARRLLARYGLPSATP